MSASRLPGAGKRDRLAQLIDDLGVWPPLTRMRRRVGGALPILAYHRVWDVEDDDEFPFDVDIVSASREGFREQMRYLCTNFDPITFRDLFEALDGGAPLPDSPVIVTFDDGYEDNYSHAFPILRELGIPATVFVATAYLELQEPFWYDRLVYSVLRTPVQGIVLDGPGEPLRLDLGERADRHLAARELVRFMKSLPDAARRQALQRLGSIIDLDVAPEHRGLSLPLRAEQLQEMSRAGIEFGSHTVSHPVMARLEPDALETELRASKERLEQILDTPVQVLSYPFGGRGDYDDRCVEAVAAAGYRAATTYLPGVNPLGVEPGYELRRLHVERYTTLSMLAATLALPKLFART